MNRQSLILAALAPAGEDPYTPVMVQKLMFLIDQEIPKDVGGPHFNFRPYDYGPYDSDVYSELEKLASEGLIAIHVREGWNRRVFKLTSEGLEQGDAELQGSDARVKSFLAEASEFVRGLSFSQLVAAIYKGYPEFRANSVFQ